VAVLRLSDEQLEKILRDREYEKQFIAKLSYQQQVKLYKALQGWMLRHGTPLVSFPDPIAMALAAKVQAWSWLERAPHLQWLSTKVAETVRAGKNLAIEMPPRMGKSTLCSVWTPAWVFTERPRARVILLTYADNFASDWGEAVRNLVMEFGEGWGLAVDPQNTAKKDWRLTSGGFMFSSGIEGQVIGKGADLLVCDDLMKEQDADSPIIREQRWKLVEGTAQSRVDTGGSILVIMQRFHEDDIIGRLEKQHALGEGLGASFEFVRLPALAEKDDPLGRSDGEGLWAQKYTQLFWEERRKRTSPYQWSAIYQQRPSPEGGGHVLRSWWRYYKPSERPAQFERVIQTWDFPLKDKQTSDMAAGFVLGLKEAMVYVLAGWIKHAGLPAIMQQFSLFQQQWPAAGHKLIEDTASGPAFIQMMRRRVAGIVAIKVGTSKLARLEAAIPAIASGNVLFPESEEGEKERWVWDTVEQFAQFPKGANDDAVDALTQGVNWLDPLGHASVLRAQDAALGMLPSQRVNPQAALRERFFRGIAGAAQENLEAEWLLPGAEDDLPPPLESWEP
jgi:predicted phage terminase large subunit-like protein